VVLEAPQRTCRDGDLKGAASLVSAASAYREALPIGAVIGTVVLGCPLSAIEVAQDAAELDVIDEDICAWPMLSPEAFQVPIPARGRQGFWRWERVNYIPEDNLLD
jgi:hypothetical protein